MLTFLINSTLLSGHIVLGIQWDIFLEHGCRKFRLLGGFTKTSARTLLYHDTY